MKFGNIRLSHHFYHIFSVSANANAFLHHTSKKYVLIFQTSPFNESSICSLLRSSAVYNSDNQDVTTFIPLDNTLKRVGNINDLKNSKIELTVGSPSF